MNTDGREELGVTARSSDVRYDEEQAARENPVQNLDLVMVRSEALRMAAAVAASVKDTSYSEVLQWASVYETYIMTGEKPSTTEKI
jgi:hypothetical protein